MDRSKRLRPVGSICSGVRAGVRAGACASVGALALAGACGLAVAPAAVAQESAAAQPERTLNQQTEAIAALENAIERSEAIGSFTGMAAAYMEDSAGEVASISADVRARVSAARTEEGSWARRYEGRMGEFLGQPAQDFVVVQADDIVSWVDDETKTVFHARRRGSRPMRNAQAVSHADQVALTEFFSGDAYQRALEDADLMHEGTETRDGVSCDVVLVTRGTERVRWIIGQADGIPRRKEVLYGLAAAADSPFDIAKGVIDLTGINTGVAIDPARFDIKPPVGYTVQNRGVRRPGQAAGPVITIDAASVVGPEVGNTAPGFELPISGGEGTMTLDSLVGEKPVLLYFWSSWARNIEDVTAGVAGLAGEYEGKIEVASIAFREREADAPGQALADAGYSFPALVDRPGQVAGAYQVRRPPAMVLIGTDGKIVMRLEEWTEKTPSNIRARLREIGVE